MKKTKRRLSKKQLHEKMLIKHRQDDKKYSNLLKERELDIFNKIKSPITINTLSFKSVPWKSKTQSKGELYIENVLTLNDIYYLKEVEFKKCINKSKNKLRFDFYLPKNNICIEYDGEQHFKSIEEFDGKDKDKALKKRQEHDKIKDDFCKENNIILIRIKYDSKDIKNDLSKILNNLK